MSCQEQACSWWAQSELPASRRSQRRTECVTGLHVSFRERQKRRKREGAAVNRPTDNLPLQLPSLCTSIPAGVAVEMWLCAEEDLTIGSRIMGITCLRHTHGWQAGQIIRTKQCQEQQGDKTLLSKGCQSILSKKLEY